MKLVDYLKNLYHSITRGQIEASCEAAIDQANKHTLPAYAQAVEFFKLHKLASPEAESLIKLYKTKVGLRGSASMVESIHGILQRSVALMQAIAERSPSVFSDVESTLGMTFQKATYLRLISSANFAYDYSLLLLNYLYAAETEGALMGTLTPAERKYVEGNFENFAVILSILDGKPQDVLEAADELPDAVVSEQAERMMLGSLGEKRMDPLGFRGLGLPVSIGVNWNPFYLGATIYADFKVAQYKAAKEQVSLIQMRKLNLEMQHKKQPSARLEQEIEYLSGRVSKLNHELFTMEQKYAG